MRCEDVSLLLAESAEVGSTLPRSIERHAECCLRCQAEQVQYRKIRRALISLRPVFVDPGPSMVGEVMTLIREDGTIVETRSSDRRRAAYVAAAATAATAATAAGALVLASRGRRPAS